MDTSQLKAYLARNEEDDKKLFFAAQQQQQQQSPPAASTAKPEDAKPLTDSLTASAASTAFSAASLIESMRKADEERKIKMEERKRKMEEEFQKRGIASKTTTANSNPSGAGESTPASPDTPFAAGNTNALASGGGNDLAPPQSMRPITQLPTLSSNTVGAPAATTATVTNNNNAPVSSSSVHTISTLLMKQQQDATALTAKTEEVERLTGEVVALQSQLTLLLSKGTSPDDKLIEAYHRDNERLSNENKRLLQRVKVLEKEIEGMHAKSMVQDTSGVVSSGPVTQPLGAAESVDRLRAELRAREEEHKLEVETLKREKKDLEKRMNAMNWNQVEDSTVEVRTIKAQAARLQAQLETEVSELKDKLKWYAENMELTQHSAALLREQQSALVTLRARVGELEGTGNVTTKTKAVMERDRAQRDLAKRVNELEEALRTRYPNSIPELIRACRPTPQELEETKGLQDRVKTLEGRIIQQGEEAEAIIKALRIECDKLKVSYESRLKQKDDEMRSRMQDLHTKREKELEKAIADIRTYYTKKISELQGNLTAMRRPGGGGKPVGTFGSKGTSPLPSSVPTPRPSSSTTTSVSPQPPQTEKVLQQQPQPPQPSLGQVVAPAPADLHVKCHAKVEELTAEIKRLQTIITELRSENERVLTAYNQQRMAMHEYETLHHKLIESESKIKQMQAGLDDRLEKARQAHYEQEWALRQEHAHVVADLRGRWEADVNELRGQVQDAQLVPKLADLDTRGRVEYLQMVSQRLRIAEQQYAFRVSELQREVEDVKNVSRMEVSVEKQKMQLMVEQKNSEIEKFRIQMDAMLYEIESLRSVRHRGQ